MELNLEDATQLKRTEAELQEAEAAYQQAKKQHQNAASQEGSEPRRREDGNDADAPARKRQRM